MNDPSDKVLPHDYDGIEEYDNPMPGWWQAMFWGTFVFSVFYVLVYHFGDGQLVAAEYAADMRVYNAEQAERALNDTSVSEDNLKALMADTATVAAGRERFLNTCAVCHRDNGGGGIGPNLTDDAWIHGHGTLADIYKVVNDGVPDKGMPSWGKQLANLEVRRVVAYVGTLRRTHVENGKAPQGEVVR